MLFWILYKKPQHYFVCDIVTTYKDLLRLTSFLMILLALIFFVKELNHNNKLPM